MITDETAAAASPRTRGWTREIGLLGLGLAGFPAHAGMDPGSLSPPGHPEWLPRARGDGLTAVSLAQYLSMASPRTRGWTPSAVENASGFGGFPAHAGMDLDRHLEIEALRWLPRARGDGPVRVCRAGRQLPASPRTRGWTLTAILKSKHCDGFPAHAGMDPYESAEPDVSFRLPRARGDGPAWRARKDAATWASRARGDGPQEARRRIQSARASPRTRGWTPHAFVARYAQRGFPVLCQNSALLK